MVSAPESRETAASDASDAESSSSSGGPGAALANGLAGTSLHASTQPAQSASDDDEDDEDDSESGDVEARFWPPLSMQRRGYILSTLRAESVRTMCEIGCGDGGLLEALCQPATFRDEFPPWRPPEDEDTETDEDPAPTPQSDRSPEPPSSRPRREFERFVRRIPAVPLNQRELHLSRVVGVDIDDDALESALLAVKPPPPEDDPDSLFAARERWEPLRTAIYKGSLAVYNGDLDGLDCFVLTEVIEHLDEATLRRFGPMVLGIYRPRLVIVTTPNYDFSEHFVASSEESRREHTWPDPTGRTDRVFRNSDHKFEFTQAEFEAWANALGSEHDYEVRFGGVGSVAGYLGRQPAGVTAALYATQCAVFRRKHANEPERSPRSPLTQPLPFYQQRMRSSSSIQKAVSALDGGNGPTSSDAHFTAPHELVGAFSFQADARADRGPAPGADIRQCVRALLQDSMGLPRAPLNELWGRRPLRVLCRGRVGAVVDALLRAPEGDDDWALAVEDERTGTDAVVIEYRNSVEPEPLSEGEYAVQPEDDENEEEEEASGEGEDDDDGWPAAISMDRATVNGIAGPRFVELDGGSLDGWDRAAAEVNGSTAAGTGTTGWD